MTQTKTNVTKQDISNMIAAGLQAPAPAAAPVVDQAAMMAEIAKLKAEIAAAKSAPAVPATAPVIPPQVQVSQVSVLPGTLAKLGFPEGATNLDKALLFAIHKCKGSAEAAAKRGYSVPASVAGTVHSYLQPIFSAKYQAAPDAAKSMILKAVEDAVKRQIITRIFSSPMFYFDAREKAPRPEFELRAKNAPSTDEAAMLSALL